MNKAQKEYVADFYANYYNLVVTYELLIKFTDGFMTIDPTPDPETYCVWMTYDSGSLGKPLLGGTGYSKEKASEILQNTMTNIDAHYVIEYKKSDYLLTAHGTRYEVRKENVE
jgi:hypothetical protein